MRDGRLDECVTFTRTVTVPAGMDYAPPPLSHDLFGDGVTYVPRTCEEQFASRVVLATCEMHISRADALAARREHDAGPDAPPPAPEGVDGFADIISRNYDFGAALDSDERMSECISGGGRWDAIPDGSLEYAAARAEFHAREAERALGRRRR